MTDRKRKYDEEAKLCVAESLLHILERELLDLAETGPSKEYQHRAADLVEVTRTVKEIIIDTFT